MENVKRFLNIPIPLLRELFIDCTKFANDAFDVGIYLYSKTLEGDENKRYKDAGKFLNVTGGNLNNAKKILSSLPDKSPIVGIGRDMLFDYYRNHKTDFEIVCFGAFLGIKSILGKKSYDKTNKLMIHARMFGYISPKDFPKQLRRFKKNTRHAGK